MLRTARIHGDLFELLTTPRKSPSPRATDAIGDFRRSCTVSDVPGSSRSFVFDRGCDIQHPKPPRLRPCTFDGRPFDILPVSMRRHSIRYFWHRDDALYAVPCQRAVLPFCKRVELIRVKCACRAQCLIRYRQRRDEEFEEVACRICSSLVNFQSDSAQNHALNDADFERYRRNLVSTVV